MEASEQTGAPQETNLSPRLLAAYRFESGTTLKAAWGIFYQTANDQQLFAAARAGFPPHQMQRGIHYLVGLEQPLRKDLALRVDLSIPSASKMGSYKTRARGTNWMWHALIEHSSLQ